MSWQIASLRYRPDVFVPTAADRAAGTAFIELVRRTPGPVLVLDHPYYAALAGKTSWAQGEAVHDVLRAGPSRARSDLTASIDAFMRSSQPTTIFTDTADAPFESATAAFQLTPGPVIACGDCFYPVTDLRRRPAFRFQRR